MEPGKKPSGSRLGEGAGSAGAESETSAQRKGAAEGLAFLSFTRVRHALSERNLMMIRAKHQNT
jgi:hypothetical protein